MFTGPQGQMRPTETMALAVMTGRVATGKVLEAIQPLAKHRVSSGLACSESLMPTRRSEIAKSAANAQWADREGVK